MKNKLSSLRAQFLFRLFIILLAIATISGAIQLYLMKGQISEDIKAKSQVIAQSIEQGMEETNLAEESLEHQIDLRLESYSRRIADKLEGQQVAEITQESLLQLRDQLDITGITLFAKQKNDIVGVKSTDPSEIGFSFKEIGYTQGYQDLNSLYNNNNVSSGTTYSTERMYALPISQSGSHKDKPTFFKYAYYHVPGTDYIINVYIEANEIYQFTQEVGPESWIDKMVKENEVVEEVAVLDPRVFADPELETKLFPPLKKVVYGEYSYKDSRDEEFLANMVKDNFEDVNYIKTYNDEKIYKMFLPSENGKVIYLALSYDSLSGPLYHHFIILIVAGLVSLVALFLLIARFFNQIYEKIQRIKSQIEWLEQGDLTVKNAVSDNSELGVLSQSVNRMVGRLNKLVSNTREQASKAQSLSVLLESEAFQSVEQMYEISTETTLKSRDRLYKFVEFLDDVEDILQPYGEENERVENVLKRISEMKELGNESTAATTAMTIRLSDLFHSLHGQSSELSNISNTLLERMGKFKL